MNHTPSAATAAPSATIAGPSQPNRVAMRRTLAERGRRGRAGLAARGRVRVVEWLGPRQSTAPAAGPRAAAAVLGLDQHAAPGGEEHGDLAGLADLDHALAEARVIDALTDVERLARPVRARRLGQIRGDRGLLEPLGRRARSLGLLRILGRARGRGQLRGRRGAVQRAVAVVAPALLALHLSDLLADLGDDDMPHIPALRA